MKNDLRSMRKEILGGLVSAAHENLGPVLMRLIGLAKGEDCSPRESLVAIQILLDHAMPADGKDDATVVYPEEFHVWLAHRHAEFEGSSKAGAPTQPPGLPQILLDVPDRT